MANTNGSFWIALMEHCQSHGDLVRLWNGYLEWKLPNEFRREKPLSGLSMTQFFVEAPPDGWPKLNHNEKWLLNHIAGNCGGHPSWSNEPYMDFSDRLFESKIDFSDLTLVAPLFSESTFHSDAMFYRTRFFSNSLFCRVKFYGRVYFIETSFQSSVIFDESRFEDDVSFHKVQFKGGATFVKSSFGSGVKFYNSNFSETSSPHRSMPIHLASFKGAEFQNNVSFRNVIFGEDPYQVSETDPLIIVADFSDAKFHAATDFRNAVFKGAPNFFNCLLHEDTDFSGVKWPKTTPTVPLQIDDAIRAWERLELIMSQLEKPLDRHQFYRLKMRTRRRKDGKFLRTLNWLFEATCDYGWSVSRAACWWIGHWLIAAVVLFLNAGQAAFGHDVLKALELFSAALGTAFANAHAFLGLAGEGGHLESCRLLLIEGNNQLGLLAAVGGVQAVLGPVFLFLLLLTLRNRFRLA